MPISIKRFVYQTLLFDCETNGLLDKMDRIHSLVIREYETGRVWSFRNDGKKSDIHIGVSMLAQADTIVGHNIMAFDIDAIKIVFPNWDVDPQTLVFDTLVASRHIFSDQKDKDYRLWERGKLPGQLIGVATLEAWGHRLRLQKGDYAKEMRAKAIAAGLTDEEDILHFVWGTWNQEMQDYCELDVDVTTALYRKILEEDYPWVPLEFEHDAHQMAIYIEENGWPFDIKRAQKLAKEIEEEMKELERAAEEHYGFWYAPAKKRITAPLWDDPDGKNEKKDYVDVRPEFGEDDSRAIWAEVTVPGKARNFKSFWKVNPKTGVRSLNNSTFENAPYCSVQIKEFKPTSRHHIIDRFTIVHDWEPVDFTETGQPSVNDDVLRGLVGKIPMAEQLAEIFYLAKRLGQIATGKEAWLKHVKADGAIHHRLNVGGTISGRCSHSSPNIAQVPKVAAVPAFNKDGSFNLKAFDEFGEAQPWAIPHFDKEGKPKNAILTGRQGRHGYDCRRLFYAPKGWRLIGCDLSGIELRCLANLTAPYDDGFLIHQILEGDIHEVNRVAAGLATRDQSKTFIYACVPYDTQALTTKGWKYRKDLKVGDLVLTYNQKTNVKEWKPILEIVDYPSAPIIEMSHNNSFKIRSTPNHRWFVNQRRRSSTGESFLRPYFTPMVKTTSEINAETNIIINAPMNETRGGLGGDLEPINRISKRGTDWVQAILNMTHAEREAFLKGFLIADGYYQDKSANSGGWNWNQNQGELAEAALLASYLVNDGRLQVTERLDTVNPMIVCHLSTKQHITGQRLVKKELPPEPVWCIRTENESWVIRQGYNITITGNTIYGAGMQKIGSIVDPLASAEDQISIGKGLLEQFYAKLPGLAAVVKLMKKQAKRGWIEGLDGRRLRVRAMHAALNLRLQSDGAVIAKKWMLTSDDNFRDEGLVHGWDGDYAFLAFVHDELQVAVRDEPDMIDFAKKTLIASAAQAGEFFNFAMAVDAEAKDGINWAMTH